MDAPPELPAPAPDRPDLAAGGAVPRPPTDLAPPPALPRPNGVAFFAIVLALFAALGTAAQASNPALGLAWSELFALLVPALLAAAGSNLIVDRALLLSRRPPASVIALGVVIGCVGFLGAGALMALTSLIVPARWIEAFDVTRVFDHPGLQRTALAVVAATVAPFCEEVAFRGWILTALRTRHGTKVAIVVSAFLFAIMHLDPVRFGALVALGIVYGWLAWRAGSVWAAIAAHATNNTLGVVLASAGAARRALDGPRGSPGEIAASALLMLSITGGALAVAASAFARATPDPSQLPEIVRVRDPADASIRFASRRIPGRLLALAIAGAALLVAIVATGHAMRR